MNFTDSCVCVVAIAAALCGCAAAPVVAEAPRARDHAPVLEASDGRAAIALDFVLAASGRGSWAHDNYWDEYRFRMRSLSGDELRLVRITLFDALGQAVDSSADREALVQASRDIEKRYEASGLALPAPADGRPSGGQRIPSIGLNMAPASPRLGGGLFLLGLVATITHDSEVAADIQRRQTPLPAAIAGSDSTIVVFFPVVPRPSDLEVAYVDGGSERHIRIEAHALAQIHVKPVAIVRPEPAFPSGAARRRIEKGHVKARVAIDAQGDVTGVEIIEASSPLLVAEAKRTFGRFKYRSGPEGRMVEELMRFRRGAR